MAKKDTAVAVPLVSREAAERIIEIFPLARFSPLVAGALGEDKDERLAQNLHCVFQLHELRATYTLLQQQIPGLNLALPILFVPHEKEGQKGHYSVLWVGDHDPYGLSDAILFHALSHWMPEEHCGIRLTITWEEPDVSGCSCTYNKALVQCIMRAVPPEVFNDAVKSFFGALKILTFCPVREKENYLLHPRQCARCGNEGWLLLHKTFGEKFRPSALFEMITGFRGWDDKNP